MMFTCYRGWSPNHLEAYRTSRAAALAELADCGLDAAIRAWTPEAVERERKRLSKETKMTRRAKRAVEAKRLRLSRFGEKEARRLAKKQAAENARAAARASAAARVAAAEAEVEAATARVAEADLDVAKATLAVKYAGANQQAATRSLVAARANRAAAAKQLDKAKAALAEARRFGEEVEAALSGSQMAARRAAPCPEVKKESYKVYSLKLSDLIGKEASDELARAVSMMEKRPSDRLANWGAQLQERLQNILRLVQTAPVSKLRSAELAVTTMSQSELTDEATQLGHQPGDVYLQAKLGAVDRLSKLEVKNDRLHLDTTELVEMVAKAISHRLVKVGVEVDGRKYAFLTATPSQQKTGAAYLASQDYLAKAWPLFFVPGQEYNSDSHERWLRFKSNGSEELKREATKATPSVVATGFNGQRISVDQIFMADEDKTVFVKIIHEALVVDPNSASKVRMVKETTVSHTEFDGETVLFVDWFGAGSQGRGPATTGLKYCAVNGVSAIDWCVDNYGIAPLDDPQREGMLPQFAADIDGKLWSFPWSDPSVQAQYPIALMMMTTSCFKAKSLGLKWSEIVDHQIKLADTEIDKLHPFADQRYLRVVRYVDGAEERQRKLGRQLLQQFFAATPEDAEQLADKAISKLLQKRNIIQALVDLGELERPEEERSALAKLIMANPDILLLKQMQDLLHVRDKQKAAWLASGRIPVDDSAYPYMTQDPVAMFQVLLMGKRIDNSCVGILRDDEVSAAEFADGTMVGMNRFPSNWLRFCLAKNKHHRAFASCGGMLILPVGGEFLIRMDGDVDGDEAFLTSNAKVLRLFAKAREVFDAPTVWFDAVKGDPNNPLAQKRGFENADDRLSQIAEALYRAEKFSIVGIYANRAAAYMAHAAQALAADDTHGFKKALLDAMWCDIASILVIDMAKTGVMSPVVTAKVPANIPMPWCQRFNKNLTDAEWQEEIDEWNKEGGRRSIDVTPIDGYLPDMVAKLVYDRTKKWDFDACGLVSEKPIGRLMFEGYTMNHSVQVPLTGALARKVLALNVKDDKESSDFVEKLRHGERFGLQEILYFMWRNESALKYKMSVEESIELNERNAAQLAALHDIVGDIVVIGAKQRYPGQDGVDTAKAAINYLLRTAFTWDNQVAHDEADLEEKARKKGSYALFVLGCLAKYLNDPSLIEAATEESGEAGIIHAEDEAAAAVDAWSNQGADDEAF